MISALRRCSALSYQTQNYNSSRLVVPGASMILAFVAEPGSNMTLGNNYVTPLSGLSSSRANSNSAASAAGGHCCIEQQQQQQPPPPPFEPLKMMRAIHVENFGGPEVLQVKTNLIVPPLTKTQVLVRVKCAGVNPVETYIREGQYSR